MRSKNRRTVPAASSEEALRRMQRQRRANTKPELLVRRSLHAAGFRYRAGYKLPDSRRSADIGFPRERVAIFIDGCFWHGCPEHATSPKANALWWQEKIEGNRRRDRDTDRELTRAGWIVIRVWEHENPVEAANRIAEVVQARRRQT